MASLQLLIGGRGVDSSSKDVHQTFNPATGETIALVPLDSSDSLALVNQVDPEQYEGTSGHLDQCDCLSQPCHCEEGAEDGRGGEDEQSADRPDSDQRRRECEGCSAMSAVYKSSRGSTEAGTVREAEVATRKPSRRPPPKMFLNFETKMGPNLWLVILLKLLSRAHTMPDPSISRFPVSP